ncbi:glycoside hydrolase family 28 protein [Mucilaginibacter sp. AW1-3]
MLKRVLLPVLSIGAVCLLGFISQTTQLPDKWTSSAQPLQIMQSIKQSIKAPVFKNATYPITNYGAKGDGRTMNTEAFKKAIEACNAAGGGRVIVPAGNFLTGPVYLKSNVELHLQDNAVITFSHDTTDYPLVLTRWEGSDCINYSPQIYAYKEKNIAVTGNGTLDGGASNDYWWSWKGSTRFGWNKGMPNQFKARETLHTMTHQGVDPAKRVFGNGHYLRPNMFQPYLCQNILISGVKMINSPMWFISPVMCENVTVEKVSIKADGPNTDGCDPDACKNVWIKDCSFDTGDDCIAIKSGRDEDGRNNGRPAENHIIEGCQMKAGHGGITIGSEIAGGARNIFATNCTLSSPSLNMILRLKTSSLRGGVIENIFVKDIKAGSYNEAALQCDMFYEEPGNHIPTIRNILIENLTVTNGGKYGIFIHAYKESPVQDLTLINCSINGVKTPIRIDHVKDLKLQNLSINGTNVTLPDSLSRR